MSLPYVFFFLSHDFCKIKLLLFCTDAWTYDFNGKLKWAPGFNKTENFDETKIRLAPIRVETFHGFVFVSDDDTIPTLRQSLGDLPEKLPEWFGDKTGKARHMVCSGRRDYVAVDIASSKPPSTHFTTCNVTSHF